MTVLAEDSMSQDSYWDVSELPPAYEEGQESDDDTRLINPPENVCPVCQEEIVREPGQKGRLRKYHPQCRPSARKSDGSRPVRVTSKERMVAEEVELALDRIRSGLQKAVIGLALVEPFDALVLHLNTEDLIASLRPVLMQWEWARTAASSATTGVSLLGIVFVVLSILLPIAANHNLIPSKKVSQILVGFPMWMMRMQNAAASVEGENLTANLFDRIQERRSRAQAEFLRSQGATVDASTDSR